MKGWTCPACGAENFPRRVLWSNRDDAHEQSGRWYVVAVCLADGCGTRIVADKAGLRVARVQPRERGRA